MVPAETDQNRPDGAALWASVLAWWDEAGVDLQFSDAPSCWLQDRVDENTDAGATQLSTPSTQPAARPDRAAKPVAAEQSPFPDSANWPQDLTEFAQWWVSEPSLDAGGTSPRIAPRGPANAQLMVLVPEPEADDRDNLLSGPHGRFLNAMLRAMNIAPDVVYVASALPRHMPLADWDQLAAQGMGRIVRHHVALVAPERLIVLGQSVLSLLGHDTAQRAAHAGFLDHDDTSIPMLAGWDITSLLGRGKARSSLWQRWLDWTAPDRQG